MNDDSFCPFFVNDRAFGNFEVLALTCSLVYEPFRVNVSVNEPIQWIE